MCFPVFFGKGPGEQGGGKTVEARKSGFRIDTQSGSCHDRRQRCAWQLRGNRTFRPREMIFTSSPTKHEAGVERGPPGARINGPLFRRRGHDADTTRVPIDCALIE